MVPTVRRGGSFRDAITLLKEDWRAHRSQGWRPWLEPGFHSLVVHRVGRAVDSIPGLPGLPLRVVRRGLLFFTRSVYGIELPLDTTIGRRVKFAHQGGIVIASDVVIGDDCLIRQNVTIGASDDGLPGPRLGTGVRIGAGAVVIGDITVGDGATIGPNAVVTSDIPRGASVVAPPPRIILGRRAADASSAEQPPRPSRARPSGADIVALVNDALALPAPVDAETPLLTSGLVDSLNLAVLLDAIEERFDVAVPVEAVAEDTFDTPRRIAELLGSLPE